MKYLKTFNNHLISEHSTLELLKMREGIINDLVDQVTDSLYDLFDEYNIVEGDLSQVNTWEYNYFSPSNLNKCGIKVRLDLNRSKFIRKLVDLKPVIEGRTDTKIQITILPHLYNPVTFDVIKDIVYIQVFDATGKLPSISESIEYKPGDEHLLKIPLKHFNWIIFEEGSPRDKYNNRLYECVDDQIVYTDLGKGYCSKEVIIKRMSDGRFFKFTYDDTSDGIYYQGNEEKTGFIVGNEVYPHEVKTIVYKNTP